VTTVLEIIVVKVPDDLVYIYQNSKLDHFPKATKIKINLYSISGKSSFDKIFSPCFYATILLKDAIVEI